MEKLIEIIQKHYTIVSIEEIEKNDPMYQALFFLYDTLKNKEVFLPLVIANALICYQLSSNGESYWEEFAKEAAKYEFQKLRDVYLFFIDFLPRSQWNKRLWETKIERLKKLDHFLGNFYYKQKFYSKNLIKFQKDIAKAMIQTPSAKTIVFSVKMFWYGSRIRFQEFIPFPREIPIPIDSRLQLIFEHTQKDESENIESFYQKLSERLDIAPLHLDAILWLNHKFIIEKVLQWLSEKVETDIGFEEA